MTTKKDESKDEKQRTIVRTRVTADETGSDAETGAPMYRVHLAPLELSREEYKALKQQQLSGDDDTVEVFL